MNLQEKKIHKAVCRYLDLQYPNVIYTSDMSGMRVSVGLRVEMKAKRCKKYAIPDLLILSPSIHGSYKALLIEIKISSDEVFKKDGTLRSNVHVQEQAATIEELNRLGYKALFGFGFNHCKQIVDNYLN